MNILGYSGLSKSKQFKMQALSHIDPRHYRINQSYDSAAALVTNSGIIAAAAEERFTGEKATAAFPINAIRFCLKQAGLSLADLDFIAHGWSFEPQRTYYEQADFIDQEQFRIVFSREAQLASLEAAGFAGDWSQKFVAVPHHLAHAASTFYPSGFNEALILVADGMGETQSLTIAVGTPDGIEILKEIPSLHSLGLFYSIFTFYLGFKPASDEYKVMGLAPYGSPLRYSARVMDLVHLQPDGTLTIPILSRNRTFEEKETYSVTLDELRARFGPPRIPGDPLTQSHKDLAAALQNTLQASLLHVLRHFRAQTGLRKVCLAGGVALNCTANSIIRRSGLFEQMFIQPAAGDDGTALGAALYLQRHHTSFHQVSCAMTVPLWGPAYSDEEIAHAIAARPECSASRISLLEELVQKVAQQLADGRVVAWFQDRMEYGPRALGNRSILADPRQLHMQAHLNRIIKKREDFRPFAPAVLAEAASLYFDIDQEEAGLDRNMLFVRQVRPAYRSLLPAITHVDGSARVQVVYRDEVPKFWALLDAFQEIAGIPILLNTSFNLRDQPIICTPALAIDTFLDSDIDLLVIGEFLLTKKNAPLPIEEAC